MVANVDLGATSMAAVIEAFILGELLKKQDLMAQTVKRLSTMRKTQV